MPARILIIFGITGVILCLLAIAFGGDDKATWLQTVITLVVFPALIYEIHLAVKEFQRNTEQFEHWRKEINAQCKLDVLMFFPNHNDNYLRKVVIRRETSNNFVLAITNHGDAPARDVWVQVMIQGPEPIIRQLRSMSHFVVPKSWTRAHPERFIVCTFRGGRDFVCYPGQTLTLGLPMTDSDQSDYTFQEFDLRLQGFGAMTDEKYELQVVVHHLWADTSWSDQADQISPLIIEVQPQ